MTPRTAATTLLLALALAWQAAAAPWPQPHRTVPVDCNDSRGLCFDGEDLWNVDHHGARLFALNPDTGAIRRSLRLPCQQPTGVAWDGHDLWVASSHTDMLYRVGRWNGRLYQTLPSPVPDPAALAWMNGQLCVAGRGSGTIYILDPETGAVLRKIETDAYRPRGLCFDGTNLWLNGALNRALYCIDPETGRQVRVVMTPGTAPQGLASDGTRLWTTCSARGGLIEIHWADGDGYTLSDPLHKTVRMVHRVRCDGRNAMKDVQIISARPPETERQRLLGFRWLSPPTRMIRDAWGQEYAVWEADRLREGQEIVAGWEADAELCSVRWCFEARPVGSTEETPGEIRAVHLEDSEMYDLTQPEMQAYAREAVGEATEFLAQVRHARRWLFDRVEYDLGGGWDDALTVLDRGTGSCSEYTFCFNGLLRSNGIATRNIGSTVLSSRAIHGTWMDKVYHRWLEVYVPGYGWAPFDSNSDDTPAGQPDRLRTWGAVHNRLFITHVVPRCGSDTPLGLNYNTRSDYRWDRPFSRMEYTDERRAYWYEPGQAPPLGDLLAAK